MRRLTFYRQKTVLALSLLAMLSALNESGLAVAATAAEEVPQSDEASVSEQQEVTEAKEPVQAPDYTTLQDLRDFDPDLVEASPAAERNYKQLFKDEVLAFCISTAYQKVSEVKSDALYTAAALHSWSRYDLEAMLNKVPPLVASYLEKPYRSSNAMPSEENAAIESKEQQKSSERSTQTSASASEQEVTPEPAMRVQLQLLKCIDLYHSAELEDVAKAHVIDPTRSYAEDHAVVP
ncbi:hypothetical protein AAEX37_00112 [Oligella sp. MSHR50489EDL]|uniref:T6SS amidase immunity protein Tai4 family protein n=1 Tax=Oligella sp. MSHR50489EDL TaxID=3139409 RepID=UPI003D813955